MAGFSELIKNFDKTRDYIRDFFIYGCKVRSDFDRKSVRTYGDEKRRVESWMGDYMRYDDSVRGRSVSISVDSGHIPENPLYNAFYSKSFTDNDIKLHFFIIDILSYGKSLTLREITDTLNNDYTQLFDEQTVRNKLKEYTEEGLVLSEKQGKTLYYTLSADTVDGYARDFKGLDDAVMFFSEVQPFGIIGNSIMKSLGLRNDLFFIKHNYMIHALEDILLPDILTSIDEKRELTIRTFRSKETLKAVPMQVLVSVQTGRRYAAVWVPKFHSFTSVRLDRIKAVKKGTVCKEYEALQKDYENAVSHCFGVSFELKEKNTAAPMKICFYADEKNEAFIIDRLYREKRCCTIEKTGENLYTLTADVLDPNEIMHWAKTFIGRIVSIEGGSEEIVSRFYDDVERMNKMYGGDE